MIVGQVIQRVKRKRLCKHAVTTRHCPDPRCKNFIGKVKT